MMTMMLKNLRKKMTRKEKIFRCKCPCNAELKDRYKGRQREFNSTECRKVWHSMSLSQQTARLKEMEKN